MQLRVAGSDTREAMGTRAVRLAAQASAVAAAPGWAAAFMAPVAWEAHLNIAKAGPWLTPLCLALGVGGAITSWRLSRDRIGQPRRTATSAGVWPLLLVIVLSLAVAAAGDLRLIAIALPAVCLLSGFAVTDAALLASRACVPGTRSAAAGIVAVYALLGLVPGAHIMLVGAGAGAPRAAVWSAAYLGWSVLSMLRAHRALPDDLRRIEVRSRVIEDGDQVSHALNLNSITVRFGPNLILDKASLTVNSGELVALVGGNGAGKSTLLRVAGGFVDIESGQVLVGGEDVTTLLPEERVATGLSFVSGARPVFPELTVMQNLRVASYRTHRSTKAFESATEALLTLVPTLADRPETIVGVLSGGEQRLLAVMQSLYRRPTVLLADELTLGLDVDARHAVMDLLQVLAEEGVAVVCVDHDLPSLLPRSNRAAIVAGGTVTLFDEPLELLRTRTDLLPATFLAGIEG